MTRRNSPRGPPEMTPPLSLRCRCPRPALVAFPRGGIIVGSARLGVGTGGARKGGIAPGLCFIPPPPLFTRLRVSIGFGGAPHSSRTGPRSRSGGATASAPGAPARAEAAQTSAVAPWGTRRRDRDRDPRFEVRTLRTRPRVRAGRRGRRRTPRRGIAARRPASRATRAAAPPRRSSATRAGGRAGRPPSNAGYVSRRARIDPRAPCGTRRPGPDSARRAAGANARASPPPRRRTSAPRRRPPSACEARTARGAEARGRRPEKLARRARLGESANRTRGPPEGAGGAARRPPRPFGETRRAPRTARGVVDRGGARAYASYSGWWAYSGWSSSYSGWWCWSYSGWSPYPAPSYGAARWWRGAR